MNKTVIGKEIKFPHLLKSYHHFKISIFWRSLCSYVLPEFLLTMVSFFKTVTWCLYLSGRSCKCKTYFWNSYYLHVCGTSIFWYSFASDRVLSDEGSLLRAIWNNTPLALLLIGTCFYAIILGNDFTKYMRWNIL